jgi:hypothetical protein
MTTQSGHSGDSGDSGESVRGERSSRPDPIALAVELAVYAPIGVAAYIIEVGPEVVRTVVARGRAEVDVRQEQIAGRVRHAKGAGQVAIAFGLPLVRRRVSRRLASLRPVTPPVPASPARPTVAAAPTPRVPAAPATPPSSNGHHVDAVDRVGADRAQPEEHLAIPGYDALSASQVVERLAGLSGEELAAVRQYEAGHRRRRTILGKIEQLST